MNIYTILKPFLPSKIIFRTSPPICYKIYSIRKKIYGVNRLVVAVGGGHCRYRGRNMWAESSKSNAVGEEIDGALWLKDWVRFVYWSDLSPASRTDWDVWEARLICMEDQAGWYGRNDWLVWKNRLAGMRGQNNRYIRTDWIAWKGRLGGMRR